MMSSHRRIPDSNFKGEKHSSPSSYSTDSLQCIWVFDRLDRNGKFSFDTHSQGFNAEDFLDKMILYSNMTWAEIKRQTHDAGKSKHHILSLESISKEGMERVQHLGYDKAYPDSIFSFAFTNITRVIGIRIDQFFHVVWYDPNHQFCHSKLKHT